MTSKGIIRKRMREEKVLCCLWGIGYTPPFPSPIQTNGELGRSTDFEVHRNWLAITHSLPVQKWYYEETSEWTLDYPPFFAWFEYLLSQVARWFDPDMLKVENLNYASAATVLFQRLSVIVTDLVFVFGVKEYCDYLFKEEKYIKDFNSPKYKLFILLVCNFGLLLVDHIHFQYNGFLFGVMILSIVRICQGRCLEGALWFAILLNLKHIYLYIAPVYFVYLLRNFCFKAGKPGEKLQLSTFSILRFSGLGVIVTSVFALSFGFFLKKGQILQVLTRLFPFKRGLCHAYWAPNFWALYNVADKATSILGEKFNLLSSNSTAASASMTGGLVKEFKHSVLPSVGPTVTLLCTMMSLLPILIHLWLNSSGHKGFIRGIVLCAFGSFMFGWHVHEKAILIIIIPLILLCAEDRFAAKIFILLSTVGHYSLFPLIFTQFETPVKYCLMLVYTVYVFISMKSIFRSQKVGRSRSMLNYLPSLPIINPLESLYLLGLLPLEIYNNLLHHFLGHAERFPFLPLLLSSFYCSIGVTYCWISFYWDTLTRSSSQVKPSKKLN